MSSNTAELTLIIRAQNLADAELAKVKSSLQGMATTAGTVAAAIADKFRNIGHRIGNQFGNLTVDILSGGRIEDNLKNLGALMAGAVAEGLAVAIVPKILEKIAATEVMTQVAAAFAAGGVTAGTAFDAAVAITMAALPFVILAAAVAALVYLIVNPEARQRAHDAGAAIVAAIGDGLSAVGKVMYDNLVKGLNVVLTAIRPIVDKILDVILAIPRAVQAALDALTHLDGTGSKNVGGNYPKGHAAGGWVGLRGPELAMVGERGPEYITPNHKLGAGAGQGGFTIQGVSERQIVDMVDRGLYFKLQRSAPTQGRV